MATARRSSPKPDLGPFEPLPQPRVEQLIAALAELYPDADCELRWRTPLELLIATILSAQSTDKKVNEVTETLFEKYRSAADFAQADPETLERELQQTGFFRQKAKNVRRAAALLEEKHQGEVPQTMGELVELPGVARKTANVVLGTAFGKAVGFVVDTHIKRLAFRLGLSTETEPPKVEQDLMRRLPHEQWVFLGHAIIWHGRRVCDARRPRCADCTLLALCPRNGLEPLDP